jgi:hypothetical protein
MINLKGRNEISVDIVLNSMKNDKFEYKKIVFLEKESFDVSQK